MSRLSAMTAPILAFFHRFGEVVGGIVLGLLYLVLLGPVASIGRWLADPLALRGRTGTGFSPFPRTNETLSSARRQG
jgi:hypothetical protein